MAIGILGPLNEVINKTAAEIIDGQISAKFRSGGFRAGQAAGSHQRKDNRRRISLERRN